MQALDGLGERFFYFYELNEYFCRDECVVDGAVVIESYAEMVGYGVELVIGEVQQLLRERYCVEHLALEMIAELCAVIVDKLIVEAGYVVTDEIAALTKFEEIGHDLYV